MITFKQGDVVLIPFPFTDFSTFKQRPAVILSSNKFNTSQQDVIVAAVTSHIPQTVSENDYILNADELQSAGLPKTSLIKLDKIVTIDHRLIHKRLGTLPIHTLHKIIPQFQQIFIPK